MPDLFDVIVLGTGGVGSATLYHLAQRGQRVLGIDRFAPGHDRGSSHGQTRIIRQAYFEHSDYVPLVLRAYPLWHELCEQTGQNLFQQTGIIEVGPGNGTIVPPVLASAAEHNLQVDVLHRDELRERFPGFEVAPDHQIVFERLAGFLYVEECVRAMASQAATHGAELVSDETIIGYRVQEGVVTVETDQNHYQAKQIIVTAGAWAGRILADLNLPLTIVRKHLHWYASDAHDVTTGTPAFFYEPTLGEYFYGFPKLDNRGVKLGEHSGGAVIDDPLTDDRSVDNVDRSRVESFLQTFMPKVQLDAMDHVVCYYTKTPDEHFIVDRHPQHPEVLLCAGLSGHGFKFTIALGEALADLAVTGETALPIGFLSLARL